jgi:hypothetical protein
MCKGVDICGFAPPRPRVVDVDTGYMKITGMADPMKRGGAFK